MKAKLTIKNPESTNTIIFDDIKDKKFFSCVSENEEYIVDLREDFSIDLKSSDHTTNVRIKRKGESYIKVIDNNGSILLPIEVLAIYENNGMISLAYKLDGKENNIGIEYI